MPRYSLDLTEKEVAELKRMAKKDDRTVASMMRVVFRRGLHVSNSASIPRQIRVDSASIPRHNDAKLASVLQTPSPARGRVDPPSSSSKEDPTTTAPPEDSKPSEPKQNTAPAVEAARLLRSLNWRGAKLPPSTTPEAFAATLVETYPKLDIPTQLRRAQLWHLDRRRPWRLLGKALMNWLDNASKPPPWRKGGESRSGQGSLFGQEGWDPNSDPMSWGGD